MTKTIVVLIAPNGTVQLQTQGFLGSQCRVASQFLQDALGNATHEHPTSEFYQATVTNSVPLQASQQPPCGGA